LGGFDFNIDFERLRAALASSGFGFERLRLRLRKLTYSGFDFGIGR
jgi:hypothetical protein